MFNKFDIKQAADYSSLLQWLGSGAIVTKTASNGGQPRPGEPAELTSFNIPPGSWVIAGQGSFSVEGASDTNIEYQLSLRYASDNTYTDGQHAYMRIQGLAFGSPIVIDAVVFDRVTTVQLLYDTESFISNSSSNPPSTLVRGQILMAIKTSSLFVYEH